MKFYMEGLQEAHLSFNLDADSLECRKKKWEIQPNFLQEIADDCTARQFFETFFFNCRHT